MRTFSVAPRRVIRFKNCQDSVCQLKHVYLFPKDLLGTEKDYCPLGIFSEDMCRR